MLPSSTEEIEALAACWLTMAQATALDEIEAAALRGLLSFVDVEIAYFARRSDGVWTIGEHVGLSGDIAGVAIPEVLVPYNEVLCAGETIQYADLAAYEPEFSQSLLDVGLRSVYAAPIMKAGECAGALVISRGRPSVFSARERALVSLFTAHVSALIVKRELVQSLETLAESVPAIVLRTDPSGWINWYNHRWYEFTGQTPEEAAGWGWQTAHHPEDFLRVIDEWPRALATGKPIEIEFRLRRYDGEYHWHLARVEPIRDDQGRIASWYGTVIDIESQKRALERSQRVADTLQEAFLPQRLPQRADLRLDAAYVSAEVDALVGGDWYDAFELPNGRIVFSIGDVTGHGLGASIIVGALRQSIFTLALRIDDPAEILAEADRILQLQHPLKVVTALVGVVEPDGSSLRYATAGHPPPIVAYAADEPATALPSDGPPLGVSDALALTTHAIRLRPDAVVAVYTDGVTEYARDALAGEERLRAVVSSLVRNPIADPAKIVLDRVLGGAVSHDDAALLVLQFSHIGAVIADAARHSNKQWRFHAADAQAAHVARREVGQYVRRMFGDTEAVHTSELIVGELLANTVDHAPGLVDVEITWEGETPVLVVRDSGPGFEVVRTTLPDDPMDEGSRGLFLVHALSPHVAVMPSSAGGVEIRVVLPLTRDGGPQ